MSQTITSEQCRAGRAMLKWTTKELAAAASIGVNTVTRFETDQSTHASTGIQLRRALEEAGISFTSEGCVCPPKKKI